MSDFRRFLLGKELGRGGMGVVWAAWDPQLEREVAVKVVHQDGLRADQLARLVDEARLTAGLEHPGLAPVHELGQTEEGHWYFAMKRIDGKSVRMLLGDALADPSAWPLPRRLRVFVQVCHTLAYAHEQGVIHCDLKPENIMVGRFGEALLVDWGLARRVSIPGGGAEGTPGYMAPEQVRGEPVGPGTDIWGLGSLLHELVTLAPAWPGTSEYSQLFGPMLGPPKRVPGVAPPSADPLLELAARAMDPAPAARFGSPAPLIDAVEAFLDGELRRTEADRHLAAVKPAREGIAALDAEHLRLTRRAAELAERVPAWAPLAEKAEVHAVRDRLERVAVERAETFATAVSAAEQALSRDPDHAAARKALSELWWTRLEEAEARGEAGEIAFVKSRVLQTDDGTYARLLHGPGGLALEVDPPGTVLRLLRVAREGLIWTEHPHVPSGVVPALGTLDPPAGGGQLDAGSWIVEARWDATTVRYPIEMRKGRSWRGRLVMPEPMFGEWVFVRGGPFRSGGDPGLGGQLPTGEHHVPSFWIGRFPVTIREYLAFLDDLPPEEADRRAPRRTPGLDGRILPWVSRVGDRWTAPEEDADGERWSPDWPVFSVSWHDATAFAAWTTARTRLPHRLPSELEWEKAGRGADGRFFPWGDRFDPALCKMDKSRPGRPHLEPVGAFPTDISPYGVRDLAGSIREWCGDPMYDSDDGRRPVRGGCWSGSERLCRLANRFGFAPGDVHTYLGFRLARPVT